MARHELGQRAGHLRRPDQEDPRHRRPERAALRLLRPRWRGRRLREHLGHRQADVLSALQTPMVRIHNRPAYNSECHATRDMGVGEVEQQLRGRAAGGLHHRHRLPTLRDADQLLPEPLAAEPQWRHGRQEEETVPRRDRCRSQGHHRRPAALRHRRHLRADRRQGQRVAPGHRTGFRHNLLVFVAHHQVELIFFV